MENTPTFLTHNNCVSIGIFCKVPQWAVNTNYKLQGETTISGASGMKLKKKLNVIIQNTTQNSEKHCNRRIKFWQFNSKWWQNIAVLKLEYQNFHQKLLAVCCRSEMIATPDKCVTILSV